MRSTPTAEPSRPNTTTHKFVESRTRVPAERILTHKLRINPGFSKNIFLCISQKILRYYGVSKGISITLCHPCSLAHLDVMPSMQSRLWICTLHVQSESPGELPVLPTGSPIQFTIGQLERGESTGALHWQFIVYIRTKRRLKGVKSAIIDWLGEYASSVHIEPCRGSLDQCITYVTKEDTRVGLSFSYGSKPIVNKSGSDLLALFRSGGDIDYSDPAWDDVLLRYNIPRLSQLRNLLCPRKRNPDSSFICEVYYGPPGTGKSKAMFQSFPEAYIKPSGRWWDYYNGESTVLMDDFDGCFLSFGDFKRYVDRYPLYVEVKGGYIPVLATHWVITTNVYPSHWWAKEVTGENGRNAIWRRFSRMVLFDPPLDGGEPTRVEMDPSVFRQQNRFLETQDPKGEKRQ